MRVMAIDYGDARTGVAVSDASGLLAGYTTVIRTRSQERAAEELARLARERQADELVMGFPRNMDGAQGGALPRLRGPGGGKDRDAGAAVGRAAHHHRGPPDSPRLGQEDEGPQE